MTPEEVEAKCAYLRQVAVVASDFHKALVAQAYPADKAGDLVTVWVEYELGWVDE